MKRFERYVAIGDSTVEGLDDPDGNGGYRGWADRLATRIADGQGSVLYANLGVRGRTTRQVRDEQLEPALAMDPDLAIIVSGTNDLLQLRFDQHVLQHDMEAMQAPFTARGAMVLTFTLPDLSDVMPIGRLLRGRLHRMNQAIRNASAESGAIVCDFAQYSVAADPRLWSADRLHANAEGHARIAAALAWHAGLPGTDRSWSEPLPGKPPGGLSHAIRAEAAWLREYFIPWIWRHAWGRSSGDGIVAKRPELTQVEMP